jgi:small GTP-binding protein
MDVPESIAKYKLIVCGRSHTGKTSIIRQYIEHLYVNYFFPTPLPVAESRRFRDENGPYELCIWDTAGSNDWMAMNASIYHGTQIIIFVASYDDSRSLPELLTEWVPQLRDHLNLDDCVRVLAVNKCDLIDTPEASVSENDVTETQASLNAQPFDVSAKENRNIDSLFEYAAVQARAKFPLDRAAAPQVIVAKKRRRCC